MTARTHDVFAFASLLTAVKYFPPTNLKPATVVVALIANIVGALMPDLDQASNRLWDLVPGGNGLGKIVRKLFLSHRTISHSIVGIVIMRLAVAWLVPKLINASFVDTYMVEWAIIIGYVSHIAIDGLTEEGVPLFWPIKYKIGFPPIKSWRIKTGKWVEKLVVFPLIVAYILWLAFGLTSSYWPMGLAGLTPPSWIF